VERRRGALWWELEGMTPQSCARQGYRAPQAAQRASRAAKAALKFSTHRENLGFSSESRQAGAYGTGSRCA